MTDDLADALRGADAERWAEIRAKADPDCRICRGRGSTQGYVAPSKPATYACPCTGMADWQRDDEAEATIPLRFCGG